MSVLSAAVDVVDPREAYELLSADARTALVDCRTKAEWTFVGIPDVSATGRPLWLVEWVSFPTMAPNAGFVQRLSELMEESAPERVLFICRSGARSLHAAEAVMQASAAAGRPVQCTNVAEGFEGSLDTAGHRGTATGWKARGLPWVQN